MSRKTMPGMYAEAAVFIISLILLMSILLWSKRRERKQGYESSHHWTTDTGRARADKSEPYLTKKCRWKMKEWGLSEKQLIDVLYHGNAAEQNKLVRQYNGYSIGIYYGRDKRDGHSMIYSCWKQ